MSSIAIIDYRAGNLTSVRLSLSTLGAVGEITSDPEAILKADRVIFPGVGAAGAAMGHLNDLGLADVLREYVASGRPFLGICLGTQIIFDHSDEDGGVDGVGLFKGNVTMFRPDNPRDKVPHMGWNSVSFKREHPIFAGIEEGSEFYFVHSYYPVPDQEEDIVAQSDYAGVTFTAAVARANAAATQFHPEKSGKVGLKLLENFLNWDGSC